MKTHITAFTAIVAALAGLMTIVSCQKETPKTGETFDMSVTGIMAEYEAESKAELVNSVRASWKGGEKVYVYDGVKCLGALTTTLDGNNDRWAYLNGKDLLTPKSGTTALTLVYSPSLTAAPAIEGGKVSIDLSQQAGTKATFVIYATVGVKPTYTNEVATFSFATSVLRVNCTGLKEGETITKAEMSNLNTSCVLSMSGTGAPTVTSADGGTITRTGIGSANGQGEAVFQVAFPYEPAAEGTRALTITQGSKHYTDETFTAAQLKVAVANNTICQLAGVAHEYVEIAGLKWATCNVGANNPTEYGWYFPWAGTTGYVPTEISEDGNCKWVTAEGGVELPGGFNWVNTPYQTQNTTDWSSTKFTKYLGSTSSSYKDPLATDADALKTVLGPEDDAATVNWGGEWRMPTEKEFKALYEACGGTGTYVTPPALSSANPGQGIYLVSAEQTLISEYTGVAGVLFCDGTSKLFFPAAGNGHDTILNYVGSFGYYWSSSIISGGPYYAFGLSFYSNGVIPQLNVNRYLCNSIRPVMDMYPRDYSATGLNDYWKINL